MNYESLPRNTTLKGQNHERHPQTTSSGTFVVNGSPTKTQIVDSAGGRSQLSLLVTAGLVLLVLIMVLAYTTAVAVGKDEGDAVHTMLVGALGCNLAWGIIDAVLYLMGCMAEKSRGLMRFQAVRNTTDAQEAQRLIADGLSSAMNAILQPAELASMHQRLKQLPEPPKRMHLRKEDWLGALCRAVGG